MSMMAGMLVAAMAASGPLRDDANTVKPPAPPAAELDATAREATQIRVSMVEMSDAMRGFLRDTSWWDKTTGGR